MASLAFALLLAVGCNDAPRPAAVAPARPTTQVARPTTAGSAKRSQAAPKMQPAPPNGAVAPWVARTAAVAAGKGETLLVYVGATWCEPCQRFKQALYAGKLTDERLNGLRFVAFDYDRDAARLAPAGYKSKYLPLFALPGPDGKNSGRQFMGATKGPGAVDFIVTRLSALVEPGEED